MWCVESASRRRKDHLSVVVTTKSGKRRTGCVLTAGLGASYPDLNEVNYVCGRLAVGHDGRR